MPVRNCWNGNPEKLIYKYLNKNSLKIIGDVLFFFPTMMAKIIPIEILDRCGDDRTADAPSQKKMNMGSNTILITAPIIVLDMEPFEISLERSRLE